MKVLAINGSHRPRKGTAALLRVVLEAARKEGADVEMIELAECNIAFCQGCNACMRKPCCPIGDDMRAIVEKMLEADAIVLGSPDYFSNVSARMKAFMERTRPLHMTENALKGKVGGAVVTAGLPDCGAEKTLAELNHFLSIQEITVVNPRPAGAVVGNGPISTQFDGIDEAGRIQWRNTQADPVGSSFARQLGADIVHLVQKLAV